MDADAEKLDRDYDPKQRPGQSSRIKRAFSLLRYIDDPAFNELARELGYDPARLSLYAPEEQGGRRIGMTKKTLDFGGLWASDPDQIEALTRPGKVVLPTLLIFCSGGLSFRLNFDIDFDKNEVTNIKYATQLYFADARSISFIGTHDDDSDISEIEWRYRDDGLEFHEGEGWWRYIPVTEEFAVKALQIPPPFFEGVRRGAKAGGYTYLEQSIVPGHLLKA